MALRSGILLLVSFIQLLLASGPASQVTGLLVRKSWDAHSPAEKTLYTSAVSKALQSGKQYQFAMLHAEYANSAAAHTGCDFLLWHRRFLVAYERMLRDLDPQFASVTLPYWNYFDESLKLQSTAPCRNQLECSTYLQDMGGSKTGGGCVGTGVAQFACAQVNGSSDPTAKCEKCIDRSDWQAPDASVGVTMAEFVKIFNAAMAADHPHDVLASGINWSFHGKIHIALGGDGWLSEMYSPFDPVFFGHHGMIDFMTHLFQRCSLPSTSDPKFAKFNTCLKQGKPDDHVVMTARGVPRGTINEDGASMQNLTQVAGFFTGMSDSYSDFADATALGPFAYTYQETDQFLQKLIKNHRLKCPGYKAPLRLQAMGAERHHTPEDSLAEAYRSCATELRATHSTLTEQQVLEQQGLLECQVLRLKSGGMVTDFDAHIRAMFHIPADVHPMCYDVLQKVARGDLQVLASASCRAALSTLTGTDLVSQF